MRSPQEILLILIEIGYVACGEDGGIHCRRGDRALEEDFSLSGSVTVRTDAEILCSVDRGDAYFCICGNGSNSNELTVEVEQKSDRGIVNSNDVIGGVSFNFSSGFYVASVDVNLEVDLSLAQGNGKSAGMAVCGVYDPSSEEYAEQMRAAADFYIRDFRELLEA